MPRVRLLKTIRASRRILIAYVLALLVAACRIAPAAAPPLPGEIDAIDPEVRRRITEYVHEVRVRPRDAERWTRLGMLYEAHALDAPAAVCYREALRVDDTQARRWYRLAVVEERLGDLSAALASIHEAIERERNYAPLHWRRGFWLLDSGDAAAALEAFRHVTERWPAEPAGWIGLARAHLILHQAAAAIEALQPVLSPDQPIRLAAIRHARHLLGFAHRQARGVQGANAVSLSGEAQPAWTDPWSDELSKYRTGYAALFKEALQLQLAGEPGRAIALFDQLRQQRPADITLLNHLAVARIQAGEVRHAISVLQSALAMEAGRAETNLNLAAAYLEIGDLSLAIGHADRALRTNPGLSKAHEVKGVIAWRQQRLSDALDAFESAVRYDPRNSVALVSAGMVLGALRRPEEALARFEAALREDPSNVDAHIGVVMANISRGRLGEADAALQQASALEPDNPRVRATAAELATRRGTTPAIRR